MVKIISSIIQFLLLAGTTLLLLFIVMSGSIDHAPIDKFYWIQADTSGISGAPSISKWTFWGICSYEGGSTNGNCDNLGPAYAFSPVDNFNTTTNVPTSFVDNRDTYYYLTRFSWVFYLISLVFIGVSFICWWFSGFIASMKFTLTFFTSLTLLLDTTATCCQTAAIVLGKNAFASSGLSSKLGPSMLGMAWASVACLILLSFETCFSAARSSFLEHKQRHDLEKQQRDLYKADPEMGAFQQAQVTQPNTAQNQGTLASNNEGGIRFFKIRRNNRTSDEESV
ncbi:hypothetical protein PACTADRAFT_48933 [Pachysolen tannophilus NRRL Y-2460]|uniref:Protein SUR7 n=1 Tax=Pachysolen tannophilus NRRL Y-2460 TaxID=669874 RepID=A0A1E4TZL7_PACTA|nr:hypothetical protein PACTADRAFT_48933 [Pachysolen tannophilus NRRL Y-2460]